MPKTISQSVLFAAPPATVFPLYANQRLHAEVTGAAATIKAKPGSEFLAWNGYIQGVTLRVVEDRMIIQTWRASDWGDEVPDSVLILVFIPEAGGTRLHMTHANVPADQAEELKKGWTEWYWRPWKKWIKEGAIKP